MTDTLHLLLASLNVKQHYSSEVFLSSHVPVTGKNLIQVKFFNLG